MTALSIRVPDSLHRAIRELAAKDGYSMNQFLVTAAAEKLSALETVDYLRHRAERAISRISSAFWPWFLIPNRIRATISQRRQIAGASRNGSGRKANVSITDYH